MCDSSNIGKAMKKIAVILLAMVVLLGGCTTSAGSGAYMGASLGGILGSAIGGLTGGWRGSDVGTVVGMATGAAVGAAAASAAENNARRQYERDRRERVRNDREYIQENSSYLRDKHRNQSNLDVNTDEVYVDEANSGDDRIYDFDGKDYTGNYSAVAPVVAQGGEVPTGESIKIANARFVDDNCDNVLSSDEVAKVIFEFTNSSHNTLTNLVPTVVETTGNKHIYISPSVHVESLAPGQTLRYTAMVKVAGKLKEGTTSFNITVLQDDNLVSKPVVFDVVTRK